MTNGYLGYTQNSVGFSKTVKRYRELLIFTCTSCFNSPISFLRLVSKFSYERI